MLATTERGMHLGDHADHLVGRGTRPPLTATATAPPRRLIRRITSNKTFVLARDPEAGPGDLAKRDAGLGALKPAPEPGV
jgi:hypothetical protein